MLGMLVLFYFLLIRPQQKKMKQHKTMVDSLKRGDSVITSGGIFGRITAVEGNILTVEIAKGTAIRILKSSVGGIANPETEEKMAQNPQPGNNP
ncbi:MAG: preprotein translocase subunit YajC [Deltaproteobacteria bacterium]|nr:preprotein translocase subunit YajC [Deltaproteobacteria bacterium]